MKFVQTMINQKMNTITKEELLSYASAYNLKISSAEAAQLVTLIKGKNIDIFNDRERKQLLASISREINPRLAQELKRLFLAFMQ